MDTPQAQDSPKCCVLQPRADSPAWPSLNLVHPPPQPRTVPPCPLGPALLLLMALSSVSPHFHMPSLGAARLAFGSVFAELLTAPPHCTQHSQVIRPSVEPRAGWDTGRPHT